MKLSIRKRPIIAVTIALVAILVLSLFLHSMQDETRPIRGFVIYESKDRNSANDGFAVADINPKSPTFGRVLQEFSVPGNVIAHHTYLNREKTRVYATVLGAPRAPMYIFDITKDPIPAPQTIDISPCTVAEDIFFSQDGRWFLTCMGSDEVQVYDAGTNTRITSIKGSAADRYIRHPHGIDGSDSIDRLVAANTISPKLDDPQEALTVIEMSSGKILSVHKLSSKTSAAGVAPVEVEFVLRQDLKSAPVLFSTTMLGNELWTGIWDATNKTFSFRQVDDLGSRGLKMPLEIIFSKDARRMFVSSAVPGAVTVYDVSDPINPKVLADVKTEKGGTHHLALSPDENYLYAQNGLLNLPGLNDGSITVIDASNYKVLTEITTFRDRGQTTNCIIVLP